MSNTIEILENNDGSLIIQEGYPTNNFVGYYFPDKRDPNTVENLRQIATGIADLSNWEGGERKHYVTDEEYSALSEGGGIRLWGEDDLANALA